MLETLKQKTELVALRRLIDASGKGVRSQMLDGARESFRDKAKELEHKGKQLTEEGLLGDVPDNKAFLVQMARVDIDLETLWGLAAQVIADRQKQDLRTQVGHSVGRNEPCPCGSGKKYKKCCGR